MKYFTLPRIEALFGLILTGRIRGKLMSPLLPGMFLTTSILVHSRFADGGDSVTSPFTGANER